MMRQLSLVLGLIGAVALATGACTSSGGNNNGQYDAGQQDGNHQLDGGQQDDGGQHDGSVTCTTTGFTATDESAGYDSQNNDVYYDGYTATTSPYDELEVGLYFDYGNPKPTIGPGTYTIGGTTAEQNAATCGTCIMLWQGCDDTAGTCAKTFFATSGTLTVTTMDNTGGFVGTLTNAHLVEVTIDDTTGNSTPVAGGQTWCIPSYSFNQALTTELPCSTSDDCSGDTPKCDTSSNTCVECLTNPDCASSANGHICDTTNFYCVECLTNTDCASNTNGHFCDTDFGLCGACLTSFDCTNAATPVCQSNDTTYRYECVAGVTCAGDDAGGANDTGPAGARTLTVGVAMTGQMCNPDDDYDWYKIQTSVLGNITFTLAFADTTADVRFTVYDATGTGLGTGPTANPSVLALTSKPAGWYYASVTDYDMGAATGALPYTITVTTP